MICHPLHSQKKNINLPQSLTTKHTDLLISAPFLPLLCSRYSWGVLVFLVIRIPSALALSGNYTINYPFSFLHLQHFPFNWIFWLLLTILNYLNAMSSPHNTSLSLISDNTVQTSGHFSCILFDFSSAWDTVKYSLFPETLPSLDTSVPLLTVSSLSTFQIYPPLSEY